MKREKEYQIKLTQSEDKLLKQVANKTGMSVSDVILLGIKYQIQELESLKRRQLQEESELLRNWEQYFSELIVREFGVRRQAILQIVYLELLMAYKDSVYYTNGNFEQVSDINGETRLQIILEQQVKEEICQSLTQFLGGNWNGEEALVGIFLNGLKTDLSS